MDDTNEAIMIYALKNPKDVLAIIDGRGLPHFGLGTKEVRYESRGQRRVFYYPVSDNGDTQVLVGVVGPESLARAEQKVQEGFYGRGCVVDVTQRLEGMKPVFASLNRFVRQQGI